MYDPYNINCLLISLAQALPSKYKPLLKQSVGENWSNLFLNCVTYAVVHIHMFWSLFAQEDAKLFDNVNCTLLLCFADLCVLLMFQILQVIPRHRTNHCLGKSEMPATPLEQCLSS